MQKIVNITIFTSLDNIQIEFFLTINMQNINVLNNNELISFMMSF